MRHVILPTILFVGVGILAHFATLHIVPGAIMSTAMERMEASGLTHHQFALAPRATPQSQTVVRPSPDLAYSVCLFDLTKGDALQVRVGAYDNYTSVSFFDDRTNNFASVRVGENGDPTSGSNILLVAPGGTASGVSGAQIEAPSERGIILIRRLAPTQADYERVVSTSSSDSCELVSVG